MKTKEKIPTKESYDIGIFFRTNKEQKEMLREAAFVTRMSESEIIRKAVDIALATILDDK